MAMYSKPYDILAAWYVGAALFCVASDSNWLYLHMHKWGLWFWPVMGVAGSVAAVFSLRRKHISKWLMIPVVLGFLCDGVKHLILIVALIISYSRP
jgi:hypothetical protein